MSEDARAYALRLLSQRSYSTRDLTRKLKQKEFPQDEIEKAISRFIESGFLDDQKFALNFARSKVSGAGASKRRIRQLLARKGISQELADRAFDHVVEEEGIDTGRALEKAARKKMASYGALEPPVIRRRLYGFLARRGYDLDEIRRVVDLVMESTGSVE